MQAANLLLMVHQAARIPRQQGVGGVTRNHPTIALRVSYCGTVSTTCRSGFLSLGSAETARNLAFAAHGQPRCCRALLPKLRGASRVEIGRARAVAGLPVNHRTSDH